MTVYVCLMVLNATFNNISVISWRSVLLVEETRGPGESHFQTSHNVVHLALIEIGTHISGVNLTTIQSWPRRPLITL